MIKVLLILAVIIANFTSNTFAIDLTFPIPELGNCNNAATCKVYCDQPQNYQACMEFAKSKGFYKEKVDQRHVDLLPAAKETLGCNSITTCKNFCQQEANQLRCQAFAQKHGLSTSSAENEQLLIRAKQNLSCDSFESCRMLCDQQENYTKCAALLQDQITNEDQAMFEKYKPQIKEFLGCDSMVTCMAFCMNPINIHKCQELGGKIGSTEQISNQESPEAWCPKYSSECRWDGTTCVCQGPQTCAQSNDIPGCSWDGTQCNCPGIEGSPEQWCPKAGPGCTWDGKLCTCPGSESFTGSAPQTIEPGNVWCPKIGPYCVWDGSSCTCWDDCVKAGGTWTGSRCDFPIPTPEPGEVWCPRSPGCSWTGEVCQCTPAEVPQPEITPTPAPAVQGISTKESLLQQIIDFILGIL